MSQSHGLRLILVLVGSSLAAPASQLPASSPADLTGSVRGIVLEATGKPLPHATVYAVPEGDVKKQFHAESNDAGEFVLDGLPKGSFFVSAFKESDGHPYNFFSFFASPGENTPVKVLVKAGRATEDVKVQLGERAARLNIRITTDDGKPLKGATVFFTRPDQPERPYNRGVRSEESLLVPPVPFHLMVEAEGYKAWQYAASATALISLKPGEVFDLTVWLERVP